MTDPNHPAIKEVIDNSRTSSEPIAHRRGRNGSTRPQVNNNTDNRRRKPKISKKKKEAFEKDDEELVRERSPLCGNYGVCPICLETLGKRQMVSTRCGHAYCQQCLKRALQSEKKCPTCRKSLRGINAYHPLFLN